MNIHRLSVASLALASTLAAQHEPSIGIEQPTYAAEFTPEHVDFRATAADAGDAVPNLQLRFLGARRTGWVARLRAPHQTPVRQQDRQHDDVRYDHGDVVEAYRIDAAQIEQSFHLASRPDGHGDLVLSIGAAGNVVASACSAAHRDLQFRYEGRAAIRYGEAIAFDRTGERIDVRTSYDGQGLIELIVPAGFVDRAVYPLVVDPTVSPLWSLSPSGPDRHPDLAYDNGTNRYLSVYSYNFGGSWSVRCGIINGGGPFSTANVETGLTSQPEPAVASCRCVTPDSFLVVWQQNGAIRGRLIDTYTGGSVAPSFLINSPGPGELCQRPTVTSVDSVGMVVAWDLTFTGESSPRSIRSRELYWSNPANPAGVTVGPQHILQTVATGYVQNARLSKGSHARFLSGGNWAHCRLVWERFYTQPSPGDFDVQTCSYRARPQTAQFSILQAATSVQAAAQIGDNEWQPDIGSVASTFQDPTDQRYCIAWNSEGDLYAHLYDDNGPVGSVFTIRATSSDESQPRIGAGSCEFTIAYTEAPSPTSTQLDVRAARVLRNGTVPANHVLVDSQGNALRDGLAISSRPIRLAHPNTSNRTLIAWENSSTLDGVIARQFEPVTASMSPFGSPCPGPLGEMATIGTAGGTPYGGNVGFRLTLANAPVNSLAVLLLGDLLATAAIPGAPGCNLYVGLPVLTSLPAVTNSLGKSTVMVPMPCSIPAGLTIACQWGIYAPTANAFGWIVSNDIDIQWHH